MFDDLILYIKTAEGFFTLVGVLIGFATLFWGGNKIIKKQSSGNNSTSIQGDNLNINVRGKKTKDGR